MYLEFLIVIAGLLGLWFGSDLLISSGKNIARHFGISYFFFGLAFVSIGTSLPEISITIMGAIDRLQGIETSGIVLGDKLGSAMVNLTLFIGIFALFTLLHMKKRETYQLGTPLIGSIILYFLLAVDGMFSRIDSIIMLVAYGLYYIFLCNTEKIYVGAKRPALQITKDIIFAVTGLAFILISSQFVVENCVKLAELWHVNQTLIGIFLLGIGTGLPEFSLVIMSIRKKTMSLSMGDLLGSNIVDLFLATGLGGVISGFIVDKKLVLFDIPVLFIFTAVFLYFLLTKNKLEKTEGIMLLLLFALYAFLKIFFMA
jgi:cation:H+ antiporter